MPPSNHVGMAFLEAEELHSRLVGPDDRREIYGEGELSCVYKYNIYSYTL